MKHHLIKALVALCCLALPATALGQPPICAERERLLDHLVTKFSEAPTGRGLAANGMVFELIVDNHGGSWSVMVTDTTGLACVIWWGEAWDRVAAPTKPLS